MKANIQQKYLFLSFLGHQESQFILNVTLAQAQKRHKCMVRPSVTAQLAYNIWCPPQGVNEPVGRNINTDDDFNSHKRRTLWFRLSQPWHQIFDFPFLRKSRSVTLCTSIHCISKPCVSFSISSFLPFPFPSSSLARVPRQMVRPGRCSPPTLPASPKREQQRAGSKVNKICWRANSEGAGEFIDRSWVWPMACLSDWEESDRWAPKKPAETNTRFKVPSLFYVVFSTLQQLVKPSYVPDQSV